MESRDNETSSVTSYQTEDVTYEFTSKTFTKTSRLPHSFTRPDGTSFIWFRSFNHERIANEAKALELVSRETTIPVPALLGYGLHPDGRQYLITEFIPGRLLSQLSDQLCSSAGGKKHTDSKPCNICLEQAHSNALEFIECIVLPQLTRLKSHQRGLEGFVMPPSWLSPDRPPWRGKQHWETLPINEPNYVFQHGDIAAHNIIMDPQTLKVKALIDWEHAGYFLPGTERWPGTLDASAYERRSLQIASPIGKFFSVDYLACFDEWDDKAELAEMIQNGELLDPSTLKHA